MNSGTHRGQNPSANGVWWHPLSEAANRPTGVHAGQAQESPANKKRPQQDSNLRSRLRRALIAQAMASGNERVSQLLGCTWGAGLGKKVALVPGLAMPPDESALAR